MPESIVKQYYDNLRAGKITATKCKKCNSYTFPPTTLCEHCGSSELEGVEFSGKGKLHFVSHGIAPAPNPRFSELAPYAYGHIELEEGVYLQAIITGIEVDADILNKYYEKGPVDVKSDILEVKGLPVLAFKPV
jgi:hypothetical protein